MPTAWNNINSNLSNVQPKIAVCIPYNSKWDPEWVDKTYAPLKYSPTNWCTKIIFISKVESLPVARDMLINQALQSDCSHIFFLDTDHVFESPNDPNVALSQLYQVTNKDPNSKNGKIVSGLYRAKQKQGFNYAAWMGVKDNNVKGYIPIVQWTGNWLEIDVAGLGCCIIDATIFKNIERPWFRWELKDEISEDFYFFELAKRHGFNIHIFTDVRLSHLGTLKVKSDGTITTQEG